MSVRGNDRPACSTVRRSMLWYRKSWLGASMLFRCFGSTLPESVLPAAASAILASLMEFLVPAETLDTAFLHPYPFQVFSYIVAFALVFRTNVANTRYWEARTQVGTMGSKWGDSAALALSFEEVAIHKARTQIDARLVVCEAAAREAAVREAGGEAPGGTYEAAQDGKEGHPTPTVAAAQAAVEEAAAQAAAAHGPAARRAQAELLHRYSLIHALALQYLRRDNDIANLCDEMQVEADGTIFLDSSPVPHSSFGHSAEALVHEDGRDDSAAQSCLRRCTGNKWRAVRSAVVSEEARRVRPTRNGARC